jgi:hypothetical protein
VAATVDKVSPDLPYQGQQDVDPYRTDTNLIGRDGRTRQTNRRIDNPAYKEALVHSIPISEVKDMKSDVLKALKASLSEKNFEPCLQAQF